MKDYNQEKENEDDSSSQDIQIKNFYFKTDEKTK